jgi:hypothetical protein
LPTCGGRITGPTPEIITDSPESDQKDEPYEDENRFARHR